MHATRSSLATGALCALLAAGCGGVVEPAPEADMVPAAVPLTGGFVQVTGDYTGTRWPWYAADGDPSTRWEALSRGARITGDLGTERAISSVSVAWYRGDLRRARFEIWTGDAAGSFRKVLTSRSSGRTAGLEAYSFTPINARYVRLVVYGNSEDRSASITEMAVGPDAPSPPPAQTVAVAVSPTDASVATGASQLFAAAVTGTADTSVTWEVAEGATCGSVSSGGLYTAPGAAGTCRVVVRSVADATRTATATVTVTAPAPVVAISISPTSATVAASGTQQLTATVTGTTNTAVTWAVSEGAACGSVTSSGLYTAPGAAATCHVVARSAADTTRTATATLTVTAPPPPPPPPASSCAAEPMRTTGPVTYYCDCQSGADAACVPGNDANAGTNPSAPLRTGWKGRFTSMAAGSTVALCRGGAFLGDGNTTRNPNCRADSTCDLRDYAPPAHPEWASDQTKRPIISGSSTRLIFLPDNGAHYEGFRAFNLQVRGSMTGQGAMFGSGNSTDVDVCNVRFSDGDLAVYWADPIVSRWKLRQSQFERMGNAILGGCTDCVLDSNYFANTSYTPNSNREHPIYISGEGVTGMRVTNNEIHGCPPGVTTGTVLLVVHGNHSGLLIENNLVQCDNPGTVNPGNYGISLDNGSYTSGNVGQERRSIVRRNRVVDCGEYGISLSQAPDSLVEDNVVVLPSTASGYTGIIAGNHAPRSQDPVNDRITIRNNTVYAPSSSHRGISVSREGTGHVVTNNVVFFGGGSGTCFDFPLASGAYARLSNNACNASWGTSLDSARVVLSGSPFTAAGSDFRPALGSPLVDAGTGATTCTVAGAGSQPCYSPLAPASTSWSASDAGVTRGGTPDIGAYER